MKNPKQYFCEDNWGENAWKGLKYSKVIWGRSSVLKFWLPLGPMLKKTNKIPEKTKTPNFKNSKEYFCEDHWEDNSEKFSKDSKVIWGGVAFWSFSSHRVPWNSWKIQNSKFQKSKTVLLWGPVRRKFRKSLKGFKSDLREE